MFDQMFTIEGRLGADPELRFSPSGIAVGKFRLAYTERKKNEAGEWGDGDTIWFTVVCFRQMAENCVDSLQKGDLALVIGKLKMEEWETDQGEKRVTPTIIADNIGPSLRFRSTPHSGGRTSRSSQQQEDHWSSSAPAESPQSEDPPF